MNAALTVTDPLAEREVSIVITLGLSDNHRLVAEGLAASKQPRDERPALVSVGLAGQMPIIRSGVFGAAADLIEEAWTAFGVQAQLAAATAVDVTSTDAMSEAATDRTATEEVVAETDVAEETVTETAVVNEDAVGASSSPRSATKPTAPKPIASNLSLF